MLNNVERRKLSVWIFKNLIKEKMRKNGVPKDYADDRNHSVAVLEKIASLGLDSQWLKALGESIAPGESFMNVGSTMFVGDWIRFLSADPWHWCKAAYDIREHYAPDKSGKK